MKGQYLAIESVATLGMGLMIAMATITLFAGHRSDMLDKGKEKQIASVKSKLVDTIYSMKRTTVSNQEVKLPEEIGSQEYTVALDNGVVIIVGPKTHKLSLESISSNYELSGTADGGTVNIFKNQDKYSLRAG